MKPVYACDPGSDQSALVVTDGRTILFAQVLPNHKLLESLRKSASALNGSRVVIEMIGHYGTGMPAGKTVFLTCVAIGRMMEAAERNGAIVSTVLRPTVKTHLCGIPRAKDSNVKAALIDKYPPEIMKQLPNDHLRSAMAVADWALANP